VLHHGIDSDDLYVRRQGDYFVRQIAAVDFNRRALLAKIATYWSMMPLGTPANSRSALWQSCASRKGSMAGLQHRQRRGYFERRRRTQAGADGNRAVDSNALRRDIVSGLDQLARHADYVIGPIARRRKMREIGHGPVSGFVELFGVNAKPSVCRGRGDGDAGKIEKRSAGRIPDCNRYVRQSD